MPSPFQAHKLWAMVKMLGGVWDESLIYDTQVHIYKTRFYSHSVEENVDQVDDMKLIGSSHAFFWMFLPFKAFAVLTKLGERNNESPAYVANTVDVGAKSGACRSLLASCFCYCCCLAPSGDAAAPSWGVAVCQPSTPSTPSPSRRLRAMVCGSFRFLRDPRHGPGRAPAEHNLRLERLLA